MRFFAAKSGLRAVRDGMVAEEVGIEPTIRLAVLIPNEGIGSSDAQDSAKPAITLPKKDWHSSAHRAVLWSVLGDGRVPGSCPAGLMAEVGFR